MAAEKFNVAAGIKAQHVPFKGPVEALTEVMAGRIDYYFLPLAPALAQIKDGKVTALAVSSDKRAPLLPDVPTTAEAGLPKAAYAFWNGMFVPAKTPPEVVKKLHDETQKAIADPGVKERLAKLAIEPLPMSQPDFDKYFKADVTDTDALAKQRVSKSNRCAGSAALRDCGRSAMGPPRRGRVERVAGGIAEGLNGELATWRKIAAQDRRRSEDRSVELSATVSAVMPGQSRPKDHVASLAYGAGHPRLASVLNEEDVWPGQARS